MRKLPPDPDEPGRKTPQSMFLPLDYHNVNRHRHKNDKTDFTVRGSMGHLYTPDEKEVNDSLTERHSGGKSFTRAVSSFKNSSLIKSVNKDGFRECIVPPRRNEPEHYFDNPQRTLDHSITQKLFDDMGNIAGSSENNLTFFQNQSSNFSAVKSKSYIDEPRINNDVDYAFEGTYYKSNRRVAPIYMANPYQPDSMDRAEI